MQHIIRPAKPEPAEAAALSELALRSKAYWGYSPDFIAACRVELSYSAAQLAAEDSWWFILECEPQRIGFYTLERLTTVNFELAALFIEPSAIGQGYGTTLLRHAKQTALKLGGQALIVQSDPNAAAFYRAAGAKPCGERVSGSVPGRSLPVFALALD